MGISELQGPDALAPTSRLNRMLCFATYSAGLAFNRVYKPLLEPLGLTYPQYLVMLVLWDEEGLTVGDIGDRLFLDSGTLTPLLKRLQAAGLVARTRDAKDERLVRVHLTESGKTLEEQAAPIMPELVCALGQTETRLAELTDEVARLRSALLTHSR
jgi:DNA-binding MarR family transcriptional regulator